MEIAHIRSEKKYGPRHDSGYSKELVNSFENLLLLCGKHHPAVDQHDSVYSVEELEEWKAEQIAQSGTRLSAAESAEIIEHIRQTLSRLTEVDVVVELRGGRGVGGGMVTGPLEAMMEVTSSEDDGTAYFVVQVSNQGLAPVTVSDAGLEYSYLGGSDDGMGQLFPRQVDTGFGITTQGPRRLLGHEDESWFCRTEVVHNALRGLYELFERLPGYVRPFAEIGATGRIRPDGWLPLESLAPYLLPGHSRDQ